LWGFGGRCIFGYGTDHGREICVNPLCIQIDKRGVDYERKRYGEKRRDAIVFEAIRFDEGFRADLVVEKKVIVELKSVEKVTPAHKKQIQTYLRLTGSKLGYLLNFGEALMKHGITRAVNNLEE